MANSAVNVNENAVLFNISPFIICKNAELLPFNLSYQNKSNELCFKFFWSLSGKIFNKM
jgi:hypothetical protein